MRTRPNILLIMSDDHAARAIGAYGSVVNATPRIDEIARRGARLDSCFCTNAICAPSRASILTGTYSHVNGVLTLAIPMDASQPTFVSRLKEDGYRTGLVGKWHLGHGEAHDPQGFDYWDVLLGQGEYVDPRFRTAAGERTEPGYVTDVITDLGIGWLDSQAPDEPWCLLVHHKAPHSPWEPDAKHAGMYADPIPLPDTFDDDYDTRSVAAHHATMRVADYLRRDDLKIDPPEGLSYSDLAAWKYQRFMEDYLAVIASVDDNVGRLIDWLDDRDQFDDTIVIYTSDQGYFIGEHGWFDKRFMYEESLRMPFLISYPRAIAEGTESGEMVANVDFARTLLEAAGVDPDPRMQGRSFWRDLAPGTPEPARDGLYYRYWENDSSDHHVLAHYGLRTERYKIIYFYNDGLGVPGSGPYTYPPEWELYDLANDPDELHNVYHDPAYGEIREQLKRELWQAQAAVGDEPHPRQPAPGPLTAD